MQGTVKTLSIRQKLEIDVTDLMWRQEMTLIHEQFSEEHALTIVKFCISLIFVAVIKIEVLKENLYGHSR